MDSISVSTDTLKTFAEAFPLLLGPYKVTIRWLSTRDGERTGKDFPFIPFNLMYVTA